MTDRVRAVFERAGYGEVYTPALEYEETFTREDRQPSHSGAWVNRPAYRVFDEHGNVLVLRPDMTIPIARLVATRYGHVEPPFRLCYFAHAYRGVRPQRGQSRELLQAGVELVGSPTPQGTAEILTVLCAALDAAGLQRYRIGIGDASLYPELLAAVGVGEDSRDQILAALARGDFVEVERAISDAGLSREGSKLLLRVPHIRGGAEVLAGLSGPLQRAATGMQAVNRMLAPTVVERLIFDLGLVRNLGYYTGAVFQVYDPAHGEPIGGGGRYDELLAAFGRPLPAVGFALNVERLHIALTAEEHDRGRA